jgi:DNA repair protein RadA/Sms
MAKNSGTAVFLVGHVTKEGAIAGPRVLEHMVDTVLYFEGERHNSFRVLRAVKNRFGSTNEIGIFEMTEGGLQEVSNPSEMFMAQRPKGEAGSVVTVSLEGTRPVLVEIQALVTPTTFGMPRRMTAGVDFNRVVLIAAVLEKRVGLHLGNQDIYVNVAGGVKLAEPAVDMGIALALASSFKDRSLDPGLAVIGEIGLTGEVRAVSHLEKRVLEVAKLGFTSCIVPAVNTGKIKVKGMQIISTDSVQQALDEAFGGV